MTTGGKLTASRGLVFPEAPEHENVPDDKIYQITIAFLEDICNY